MATLDFRHLWDKALSYEKFVEESTENCVMWTGKYRTARIPEWAYKKFCKEGDFATAHGMSPSASASRQAPEQQARKKSGDPYSDPNATFIPQGESIWSKLEPGAIGSSLVLIMLISMIGYGGWSVFQAVQKVQLVPVDQAPGVTSNVSALESLGAVAAATDEFAEFEEC